MKQIVVVVVTLTVNRLIEGPLNLSWKVIILQLLQSGHHYQKLGLLNGRLRVCHRVAPFLLIQSEQK